jgi:hypothetical protein
MEEFEHCRLARGGRQASHAMRIVLGLLELYLYIVVSLIVRVFPAYFTPVHVLYIVAFGPSGIHVAYSYHGIRARLDTVLQHPPASLPSRRRCHHCWPSFAAGGRSRPSCRSLPRCSSSDRPPLPVFIITAAPSSPLAGCLRSQSAAPVSASFGLDRLHPPLAPSGSTCSGIGHLHLGPALHLLGNRPSATCFDLCLVAGCPARSWPAASFLGNRSRSAWIAPV